MTTSEIFEFFKQGNHVGFESHGYEVIALPGEKITIPLQEGDTLLRAAFGEGLAFQSPLISGELMPQSTQYTQNTISEKNRTGHYAEVLETSGNKVHNQLARRITDEKGYLPRNQMIIRPLETPEEKLSSTFQPYEQTKENISITETPGQAIRSANSLRRQAGSNQISVIYTRIVKQTSLRHPYLPNNPLIGVSDDMIQNAYNAHHIHGAGKSPALLLAIWVKEGGAEMHKQMREDGNDGISVSSATNARSVFRSDLYYNEMGMDTFIAYQPQKSDDNKEYPFDDANATRHETIFLDQVSRLHRRGYLSRNISSSINNALTVTRIAPNKYRVIPTNHFYSYSLLLADALFREFEAATRRIMKLNRLPDIGLTYMCWNLGARKFRRFIASAERHRKKPRYRVQGRTPSIVQWALERPPASREWREARENAIKFKYFEEVYHLLFNPVSKKAKTNSPTNVPINNTTELHSQKRSTGTNQFNEYNKNNDISTYLIGNESLYTPNSGINVSGLLRYNFRTAPNPVYVQGATAFPESTTNPDQAITRAFQSLCLTNHQINTIRRRNGFNSLRPIAEVFGDLAFEELLKRLRYHTRVETRKYFVKPPHGYNNLRDLRQRNQNINVRYRAELLAPRVLMAIPGHFRELARKTTNAIEAYAMENLGWLLMYYLRDKIHQRTRNEWWLPPKPLFVTGFLDISDPEINISLQPKRLIANLDLVDKDQTVDGFLDMAHKWEQSLPGLFWKAETGQNPYLPQGLPFYPQLVSIPAPVNFAAQKARIDTIWRRRLNRTINRFPTTQAMTSAQRTRARRQRIGSLNTCRNNWLTNSNLISRVNLQGIALAYYYPCLTNNTGNIKTNALFLNAARPIVESFFQTIYRLGWNDLLFQTSGTVCFRGQRGAATIISEHGYGLAIDIQVMENPRKRKQEVLSPRIVAIFEAYGFTWGKRFRTPDPHHFEL